MGGIFLPCQLFMGDAAEPGIVVNDGIVWHDQALVDGLTPDIDDSYPCQLIANSGTAHFAV